MTSETRRWHPVRTLFVLCMLLLIAGGVIGYANGWLKFASTDETTTIELKTGKMKEAASDLKAEGKKLIEKTGDALKGAGEAISPGDPSGSSNTPAAPQGSSDPAR